MENENFNNEKRKFQGIWIPAEIWLNKKLSFNEKILLIEIQSLDNENGCFASNRYFAEFFGLSISRISHLVSELIKKDLIYSENKKYKLEDGSIQEKRILHIKTITPCENSNTPLRKQEEPIAKIAIPPCENSKHNNIYNNISNNKREIEESSLSKEIDLEPFSEEKTDRQKEVLEYNQYRDIFKQLFTASCRFDKPILNKIMQTESKTESYFWAIKYRQREDEPDKKRLSMFREYAANYLNSTAKCYLPNGRHSFTVFLKFYEKFDVIQKDFETNYQTQISKKESLDCVFDENSESKSISF